MAESYFTLADKEQGGAESAAKKRTYSGMERRFVVRRSGLDRRQEVRFELGKSDRRDGDGRRG